MATTAGTKGVNVEGLAKVKDAIVQHRQKTWTSYVMVSGLYNQQGIKGTNAEATLKSYASYMDSKMGSHFRILERYQAIIDNVIAQYKQQDVSNNVFTDAKKDVK